MSVAKYSFINAKIRGFKADMLTKEHWDALLGARDMNAALRVLDATSYSEIIKDFDEKASPIEVEQALKLDFNRVLTEIYEDIPKALQPIMNWINRKFQREVVKPLLRLFVTEKDQETAERLLIPVSPFTTEVLLKLLNAKDLRELVTNLPDQYFQQLVVDLLPQYEKTGRLVVVEQAIDAVILENLYREANKLNGLDREVTSKLVGIEIDLINFMTTLRTHFLGIDSRDAENLLLQVEHRLPLTLCKEAIHTRNFEERVQKLQESSYGYMIGQSWEAYEQYQNLYTFEKVFHEEIRRTSVDALLGYPFHFGIVLGYLNLKWYEILNLKALMNGKADQLDPNIILRVLIL
ncbi:MAG: V-type ATPase subunit [Candidatus Hodarchaeota archaeon]